MNNKRPVIQEIPKVLVALYQELGKDFFLMCKYTSFYYDVTILQLYSKIFTPDIYNCIFNSYNNYIHI